MLGKLSRRVITIQLVVGMLAVSAFAEYFSWTGNGSDNLWKTAANWDRGKIPWDGDNVFVTSGTNNPYMHGRTTYACRNLYVPDGKGIIQDYGTFNVGNSPLPARLRNLT